MANVIRELEKSVEGRVVRLAERPISFEEFVELGGKTDFLELVDGVIVEKPMVQLDREKLLGWLYAILGILVRRRNLGIVLSSRILIEIDRFGGRMPDLLFVRRERMDIVQQKAVYGAPDLVIEIVSPNDRPSDIIALETDYRAIGVAEIVFIEPRKRRVRALRRRDTDYEETELTAGTLTLETLAGLPLKVEWLLQEPRPDELDLLIELLSQTP
jgi:Uma2 family endonuclease